MRIERCPVEGTGRSPGAFRRQVIRLARPLPAVVWLSLAACQGSGAGEAETDAQASANPHEGVPGAPTDIDSETMQRQMALMTQLQAIDQVLTPVREQAMQDPEMQAREQEIMKRVDAAMEAITPGIGGMRTRFDSLRVAFGTAQQAGDQERVQALGGELQTLQMSIRETQSQALQHEDVASAIDEMREDLFDRMRALDPAADSLLLQAEELMNELEAMAERAATGEPTPTGDGS